MRRACLLLLLAASSAIAGPPNYEDAPLRAVTFADAREGWAVGDEGVVWHTIDAGTTWERQPTGTRASLRAVQFLTPYTGFVVGRTELPNRAGSQGVLLGTTDGGVTWATVTETLLPGLNAVQFFDDKRGVVAGDGSDAFPTGVFRTEDGGRSWAMLPGPRAGAWTGLRVVPSDVTVVDGGEGWAVSPGSVPPGSTPGFNFSTAGPGALDLTHARHGAHGFGAGTSVGEFGTITQGLQGKQRCGGQRPAAVFAFRRSADVPLGVVAALAADGYLCLAVASDADAAYLLPAAMRLAGGAGALRGDPGQAGTLNPEVIVTDMPADGLKAAKVYTPAAGPGDGVVSLNLHAYVPELGGSPRDAAEPAALLFGPTPVPDALHFKLVGGTLADAAKHTSLMQGIDLAEGGTARRRKPAPADPGREAVHAARRELDALLAGNPSAEVLTQAVGKLGALPEADAARTGTRLGLRLAHAGRWTAARCLFAAVADNYAAHPEAVEALRWLVRFHSSGEARRRLELGHFPPVGVTGLVDEPADPVRQAAHTAELSPVARRRFASTDLARGWVQPAADLHPTLAAFGAAYGRDPATGLCLAAAQRRLGLAARASDRAAALVNTVGSPWAGRLGDELRLAGLPGDHPRGSELVCRFVRTKPFLDGKLDDACWKDADPVPVDGGTARLVCDDEFLYVGVACKGPASGDKLPRDSDLTGRDRVELALDLDRDYTTLYRLAVDSAGSVADECWGDRSWNPKLFVATARTGDGWAVEVAIPLAELSGTKPTPGDPWAGGVARRNPGDAAAAELGLLRFAAAR